MVASPSSLRVLARPAFSSARSNPYTSLIYAPLVAAGHTVAEYRLDRALLGRWDVVHVHWPESVFNHTLAEAWPTTESLLLALRRARANGAKVVWTVHNLRAHERRHPAAEAFFRRRFFALLDGVVALSEAGLRAARETYPALEQVPGWVVPHPHYRGCYPDAISRAAARRALDIPDGVRVVLNFGRVFEYKNVPMLFDVVKQSAGADWMVVVAGRPRTAELAAQLRAAAAGERRIRLDFEFIPDSRVQDYFRAADLVVLPYREILNSGTALLALSFDRPVLLPGEGAGGELVRRIGKPWVHTFDGGLSGAQVERAMSDASNLPERTGGEHLSSLSSEAVGKELLHAFWELKGG